MADEITGNVSTLVLAVKLRAVLRNDGNVYLRDMIQGNNGLADVSRGNATPSLRASDNVTGVININGGTEAILSDFRF